MLLFFPLDFFQYLCSFSEAFYFSFLFFEACFQDCFQLHPCGHVPSIHCNLKLGFVLNWRWNFQLQWLISFPCLRCFTLFRNFHCFRICCYFLFFLEFSLIVWEIGHFLLFLLRFSINFDWWFFLLLVRTCPCFPWLVVRCWILCLLDMFFRWLSWKFLDCLNRTSHLHHRHLLWSYFLALCFPICFFILVHLE